MSLRIEVITKNTSAANQVKELFLQSFPVNEQIPMRFLHTKAQKDYIDFLSFYDDDVFVGATYLITRNDLTFVLYLATHPDVRSQGYGSNILSKIREMFPHNQIILNIESPDEATHNYEERLKRKQFYLRNGFRSLNYYMIERKQTFEVLVNGKDVSIEEYRLLFRKFTGSFLSLFYKPKFQYVSMPS